MSDLLQVAQFEAVMHRPQPRDEGQPQAKTALMKRSWTPCVPSLSLVHQTKSHLDYWKKQLKSKREVKLGNSINRKNWLLSDQEKWKNTLHSDVQAR